MNKSELKRELNQAFALQKTIESNIMKLESIRALGEKVTASYSAEMPGAHNASSKVENAAVSLADVSKTIKDETDELAKKLEKINQLVGLSGEDYRIMAVMKKRYLCYQSWAKIADEMHYGWKQIFRLHNRGLENIIRNMEKGERHEREN
jgi:hypothetical protein